MLVTPGMIVYDKLQVVLIKLITCVCASLFFLQEQHTKCQIVRRFVCQPKFVGVDFACVMRHRSILCFVVHRVPYETNGTCQICAIHVVSCFWLAVCRLSTTICIAILDEHNQFFATPKDHMQRSILLHQFLMQLTSILWLNMPNWKPLIAW